MPFVVKTVFPGRESVGFITPTLQRAQEFAAQILRETRIYASRDPKCRYSLVGTLANGDEQLGLSITVDGLVLEVAV